MRDFQFCCVFIAINSILTTASDEHLLDSKVQAEQMEKIRCGYKMIKLWTAEVAHSPFAAAPLISDMDGDGKLDIAAVPLSESLTVVEAETGRTLPNSKWPAQKLDGSFFASPLQESENQIPLRELQTVVEAETGRTLPNSKWPAQKLDGSFFASPLQYDINGNGMLDLVFVTSSGELIFYTPNGTILNDYTFEIPPVHVKQFWYKKVLSASGAELKQFVLLHDDQNIDNTFIPVDPHVLATPVIVDLNNDGKIEEMVIPVSYYFDEDDYRLPENFVHINNINGSELQNYVLSGVVILNLSTMKIAKTVLLDLTTKNSGYPAYVLFSPTVIDMDRNGGSLEIILGTSVGNLHVIDVQDGVNDRPGFPYSMGTIHGQVTAGDLNKDGTIELVAIDTSGNVICLNDDGTLNWESKVSGTSSPGSRLTDVNKDGYLDVIITTNEGDVYALHGVTGNVLDNWPIKVGHPILSNVLVTQISRTRSDPDLVFLSSDGVLHVVSLDQSCRTHFPVGETSLVQILSHDLVIQSEGLEILISTNDGALMCLGSGDEITNENVFRDDIYKSTHMLSLPSETRAPNDFIYSKERFSVYIREENRRNIEVTGGTFNINVEVQDPSYRPESQNICTLFSLPEHKVLKFSVYIREESRRNIEVTGGTFNINLEVQDPSYKPESHRNSQYTVKVYFGRNELHRTTYSSPGSYIINIPAYPQPSHGHICVVLTNNQGLIAQQTFPIRFNQVILEDLQWLLMAPFVTMVIILLVIHGFPAKDLLPVTYQSKKR